MYFTVHARLISETAADFLRKLYDGTFESQKPDGKEIVAAIKRVKIDEAGIVRWSELCYCKTPLEDECATVYNRFFEDIETEEIDGQREFDGEDFMESLARLAG